MIKNYAFKKILMATIALIIIMILYFFPKDNLKQPIPTTTKYLKTPKSAIYLKNQNNYIARIDIINQNKTTTQTIKYLISCLTIESPDSIYIPYHFTAVIPKNTKLIGFSLNNGLLKLNFSSDFLKVEANNEEKMIESLIYTLTSLPEVNQIMILVEDTILNKLPHSLKQLPSVLDKTYGINKIYNLNQIKNTTQVTSYYLSKEHNNYYYIPITYVSNNQTAKIKIIIEQLKTRPITKTNLIGFLHANAELKDYEIRENEIDLSFNNYLFDDFEKKTVLEEVKYAIAYSIKDTYGIETINFKVNDENIAQLIIK